MYAGPAGDAKRLSAVWNGDCGGDIWGSLNGAEEHDYAEPCSESVGYRSLRVPAVLGTLIG